MIVALCAFSANEAIPAARTRARIVLTTKEFAFGMKAVEKAHERTRVREKGGCGGKGDGRGVSVCQWAVFR
jgi:hypothetical protein